MQLMTCRRILLGLCLLLLLYIYPCSAEDNFSFVVFGDIQGGHKIFNKIIKSINENEKDISFAVCTGDFTSWGKLNEYQEYRKTISKLNVKTYNVLGNHDAVNGGYKLFQKYFGPLYYSFKYNNAKFIIINNSFPASFTKKQELWLTKQLNDKESEHIFVFMHRPLFDPSGFHETHIMKPYVKADELIKLFSQNNVKIVFAGHIHGYSQGRKGNTWYVVSGGAGASLYLPEFAGGFHNYVKVVVEGENISYDVVRVDR